MQPDSTLSRRTVLLGGLGIAAAATGYLGLRRFVFGDPLVLNDVHSQLNEVRVASIAEPGNLKDLASLVRAHAQQGKAISICGSRHAMGGQQFASGSTLVDTRSMKRVLDLDTKNGIVEIEAGIEWPDLVKDLLRKQPEGGLQWTIPTKQTGADKLTLGGAIAANAHGRGLDRTPISGDLESFVLVNDAGDAIPCSRTQNRELFSLVLGGYGLFGAVSSVQLKLVPRQKVERVVIELSADRLMKTLESRIAEGYVSGDWQFAIDETSEDYLQRGVCSCYRPVSLDTSIELGQKKVSNRSWRELVYLAHTDKSRAYQLYLDYYLSTTGQVYWSDTSQLGGYAYDYHRGVDERMHSEHAASEMITELYVPRERFADFMSDAADSLRKRNANVIYGTVRLIKKDTDSFLAWAKKDYACIIFNLHVEHTDEKTRNAVEAFRALIDIAADRDGSYFLTYHRWARLDQVERCYPQFEKFLQKKRQYDPNELFQSEWYRHYRRMFDSV